MQDFFPTWPMRPNPRCGDANCRAAQDRVGREAASAGAEGKGEGEGDDQPGAGAVDAGPVAAVHDDNEWGIEVVASSEPGSAGAAGGAVGAAGAAAAAAAGLSPYPSPPTGLVFEYEAPDAEAHAPGGPPGGAVPGAATESHPHSGAVEGSLSEDVSGLMTRLLALSAQAPLVAHAPAAQSSVVDGGGRGAGVVGAAGGERVAGGGAEGAEALARPVPDALATLKPKHLFSGKRGHQR